MARVKEQLRSLSAGSLLLNIASVQQKIDSLLTEVETLREERDGLILEALEEKITYRLLQNDTGLARSTLIKINQKGSSR